MKIDYIQLTKNFSNIKEKYNMYLSLYESLLSEYNLITCNSKNVKRDSIFVVIKGLKVNGKDYIENAIKNGARLIVYDAACEISDDFINLFKNLYHSVLFLETFNSREFLAFGCRYYYNFQPKFLAAVTGTDGKTSTAFFVQKIMYLLGVKSMYLGTIGLKIDDKEIQNSDKLVEILPKKPLVNRVDFGSLTTAAAEDFFYLLNECCALNACAFEASSIGIDQDRITFSDINVAVFTNLHEDHLDVHGSYENYENAKIKLFDQLLQDDGVAVIFDKLSCLERVKNICKKRGIKCFTYGCEVDSVFFINNSKLVPCDDGYVRFFNLHYEGKVYDISIPIYASFQVYNVVAAIIVVAQYFVKFNNISYEKAIQKIINVLLNLTDVRGRMEKIPSANIFVDYAHTPNGLLTLLKNLREIYKKIILIFGCGGNRDAEKRSKMGVIAYENADIVIITDDNPRNDNAEDIRCQIEKHCPNAINIGDRKVAIEMGIHLLSYENDSCLVIAGKGHENYQIIGDKVLNFNDYEVAVSILKNKI